jgi:hypothetical protein
MKEQLNKFNQRLRVSLSIMVLSICTIFLLLSNSATAQTNIVVTNVPGATESGAADVTITATAENVYSISNVNELRALSHYVMNGNNCEGKVFNLTADIDFTTLPDSRKLVYSAQTGYDLKSNFVPIGGWGSVATSDFDKPFKGAFNGNAHTIKGLNIQLSNRVDEARMYIGLFGLNEGNIMNVGVINSRFQG